MGSSAKVSEFERRVEEQYGLNRGLLLCVGIACIVLGAAAVALPSHLFGSFLLILGAILIGSGLVKATQLLLGRRSPDGLRRGWPVIVGQVTVDFLSGILLINHTRASIGVVTALFGLGMVAEGMILLYMAMRSPTVRSRHLLVATGLATGALGLAITFHLAADPLGWAGYFVGLKLILFGSALTWIAAGALRSDRSLVYEAVMPDPEAGELYAVYFGTAFHLGVYIGDGEIVHYLNDNHVYRVSWETFLESRTPQHWTYPDLDPVPVELVRTTALSEVGKSYPYNLLTFNCEHFAVFCKSGGRTRSSKYAQVAGSLENVRAHPVLGMVAELNTRVVEWLAFHFGGPAGRQFSLTIRRIGSAITAWLLDRHGLEPRGPQI